VFDKNKKSGLAPDYPRLDPDNYAGEPEPYIEGGVLEAAPKPAPEKLDAVFQGERYQQRLLCGLRTWEVGSFNKWLPYGFLGGHEAQGPRGEAQNALFDTYSVQVNETAWHPVFHKSRWYDLKTRIKDKVPNASVADDAYWSVDVPELWAELSVVLEMANRIMIASASLPLLVPSAPLPPGDRPLSFCSVGLQEPRTATDRRGS